MERTDAIHKIEVEYDQAKLLFAPFHSMHEGYAVIQEEVDELWELIKNEKSLLRDRKAQEAVHVAAMALRFLIDCC